MFNASVQQGLKGFIRLHGKWLMVSDAAAELEKDRSGCTGQSWNK